MENTVKVLAEEFFTLTGRPISTMTMDEYISLRQYAENTVYNVGQRANMGTVSNPVKMAPDDNDKMELPIENKKITVTEEEREQVPPRMLPITQKSSDKVQGNALSMLKAISG